VCAAAGEFPGANVEYAGKLVDFGGSEWAEVPASFRSWPDYEDRATSLRDWSPSIVTGLLQVEGYARALLETSVGVTPELVTTRLAARMDRQRRILGRIDHPSAFFLVDEMALYRDIGGPDVMAGQLRHLASRSRHHAARDSSGSPGRRPPGERFRLSAGR
jgi:Domain of unknown function (DUF5753)